MTAQEIFDKVAAHLKKQRACSMRPGNTGECAYRGKNRLKCAVGALIPDELYKRRFEGGSVRILPLAALGLEGHRRLLVDLMLAHDSQRFEVKPRFRESLKRVAKEHGLVWKEP